MIKCYPSKCVKVEGVNTYEYARNSFQPHGWNGKGCGHYLQQLEKEMGPVDDVLREGRIKEITKWLNERIHQYGSTRRPKEVIEAVCHTEPTAEPLIRYFTNKYTELYNL